MRSNGKGQRNEHGHPRGARRAHVIDIPALRRIVPPREIGGRRVRPCAQEIETAARPGNERRDAERNGEVAKETDLDAASRKKKNSQYIDRNDRDHGEDQQAQPQGAFSCLRFRLRFRLRGGGVHFHRMQTPLRIRGGRSRSPCDKLV